MEARRGAGCGQAMGVCTNSMSCSLDRLSAEVLPAFAAYCVLAPPDQQAFRLGGGFNKLLALLGCSTDASIPHDRADNQQQQQEEQGEGHEQQQQQQRRRLQRKVLALLQYVLAKHPADGAAAAEYGVVPRLQQLLVGDNSDSDSDMRAATLAVLLEVVSTPAGWQWVKQHGEQQGLLHTVQQLLKQQQQHGSADEDGDEEEQQLLHKVEQLLAASSPPEDSTKKGLSDHIELDPYQVCVGCVLGVLGVFGGLCLLGTVCAVDVVLRA